MLYQFHSGEYTQNLPLQLKLFGHNYLQDPVYRLHGVPYYQWFYCVKGQGELIIDTQKTIVSENQGFLIYPDKNHVYRGLTDDWTLHIFAFEGSLCQEILSKLQMKESGTFSFTDSHIFEKHIQILLSLYGDRIANRSLAFSKECYGFLLDISQCITHTHGLSYIQDNDLILKIVTYMESNYHSPISLDQLAGIVNLSKDYMCVLFKKATGQTIMNCLNEIRLGHARHFLCQYPNKRIKDIAALCGFESPSYFGKCFKDYFGMTPEQSRKK